MLDFFKGFRYYFSGYRVINEHRLWPYMVIPGILSVIYASFLVLWGRIYFRSWEAHIMQNWVPGFLQGGMAAFLVSIALWVSLLLIGYMTYKYVVLIAFSPILSYLSELVESRVYDVAAPDFEIRQMIKDIIRGLVITLRNLILTVIFCLFAWLLVFIPLAGAILSPLVMLLVQSYYDGFGLLDYTLERKRYSVGRSVIFVKKHRFLTIGLGTGFVGLMFIPVVGWFFAPSLGTVAATLAALEKVYGGEG